MLFVFDFKGFKREKLRVVWMAQSQSHRSIAVDSLQYCLWLSSQKNIAFNCGHWVSFESNHHFFSALFALRPLSFCWLLIFSYIIVKIFKISILIDELSITRCIVHLPISPYFHTKYVSRKKIISSFLILLWLKSNKLYFGWE